VIAKRREVGDLRAAGASLNNLGLAQQNVGQYDLALDSFTQSLEMVETAGDMTSYGSALNNIGVTYEMLGLFERALGYYQQCHKIRLDTGDRTGECEALNNIGLAHYNLDQYDLALDYLSRSSAIADELGDPRLQAWALNNTGLVYDMRHQYEKAYELYAQAEGLKRANGDLLGAATSRNNAAMVRFSQGRYDEALDGVEATLSVWEQAGDRHSLLIGLNNLAAIHLQIDQPGKAAESSRRAVALAREQVRQFTWESGLKTGLADELRYAGILQLMAQLEQEQADEAFATVQSIKGVPLLQLLLQVQSVTRDDEARKALDRYRNAQALIQTARDQLLALPGVDQLTAQATDEYGVVDEAQLQALSEQDVNQREYFTGQIERQSAIAADAWDYLRKNDQRLTEIIAVNGLTAGAVKQEVLQPGQVLLEYLVVAEMGTYNLRPEVIILCLPAGGELTIARQPMTMITPDGTADEWIAGLVTQLLGRDAGQSREAGRTLYDLLIGPVAGVIPADSKLLLCPDRMLHAVPFEALTDNAGSYVLDEYPVSYATSATMLSYIPPAVEARDGALVAGLSFGGAEAGAEQDAALQLLLAQRGGDEIRSGLFSRDSFFPLPGVPDEVRDVAGILGTAESLDAAVTEKFLVEEMPGHEVIHLATHGFLHSTPLLNGIVAWLPGEPEDDPAATGNTGYDGFLTMSEIMGLKLNECRLVALSCCHSAEGEIAPGQGVMGLSQGFMYAGAQTVLASLDKVDDAATRELMAAFYLHWYEQGMSKQAALQAAKQQISADSDWQLPRYWAPFVLYGK